MQVLITGATGLIGRRLVLDRLERDDQVVIVSRDAARAGRLFAAAANQRVTVIGGNPAVPGSWQDAVNGCDAVIHLAGAGIADRRWNTAYKKVLLDSRIDSTHQVVEAIDAAVDRPGVLINASAVGYYGDTADQTVDEGAAPGDDFLAKLTVRWEEQAHRARSAGVRVVRLRFGIVLDERGGALAKMITPFRLMLGGPLGSGRQYMPWIHWRDVVGLIDLALKDRELSGPVNVVAPEPVTNRTFARTLGSVLRRPALVPTPRFALRLAIGEFAKYVTMSQRVAPAKAERLGYRFLYPELRPALDSLVGPRRRSNLEIVDRSSISPTTVAPGAPGAPPEPPRTDGAGPARTEPSKPQSPMRLLAIDVDGTLLRSDARLSQGVVQACRAAERAGCVVVLATARGPRMTSWIIQALDITAPTINYNGALIWNPLDNVAQFHEPLSGELAGRIIAEARSIDPQIMVAIEVLDRWFTDRIDRQFDQLTDPDAIAPLRSFLSDPVTRVTLLGMPEPIQRILGSIREKYWQKHEVALFNPDPQVIQVTHRLVDKGIALQRVAQRMGADREEVMVIADADNDLGMMEWAGLAVAVGNATDQVKQLADAVVPSNDDQGVARAIHRYILTRR